MKITIKQLAGPEGLYEVSPECTAAELKIMIEEKWKIPRSCQTLVLKGKPLEDSCSLNKYSICEGAKLFLTVKKSGAQPQPTSPSTYMSQMLSSMGGLGSNPSPSGASFWEKLDPLLSKHFTKEDALKVKDYYRQYLKQCVSSLSLDDIERLASLGIEREKHTQVG